jgi:hypothetical protein
VIEAFVIAMCLGDWACTEALQGYKGTNPVQFKHYKKQSERLVYSYIDKEVFITMSSIGTALVKKELKVKIAKKYVLSIDDEQTMLYYKIEY